MRRATPDDVPQLLTLMAEMYAELGTPMNAAKAESAFRELTSDPSRGWVTLLEADGQTAGYMAVTLGFSIMFGGRDAFVDDLYVREAWRDRGLGTAAIAALEREAPSRGINALHLLVAHSNGRAESLYRRLGFTAPPFRYMTLVPRTATPSALEPDANQLTREPAPNA